MRNKIIMFALVCALMVGLFPLHHAEKAYAATEQVEWSNFGEYLVAKGYNLEELPFEYDSTKQYVMLYRSYAGYYHDDYIFVYDEGVQSTAYYRKYESSRFYYKPSECSAIYNYDYEDDSWTAISTSSSSYNNVDQLAECKYTDFDIMTQDKSSVMWHKSRTGQKVSFEFALADMPDTLKNQLQEYSSYVVARIPYRINDWQSEQIMIVVSNGSRVILRDEAYNQITFSTGSGAEIGLSYIYCSECCSWICTSSDRGYIIGDSVASGGLVPEVLWTNCDIYYEEGTSYKLTDELFFEAYPYGGAIEEETKEVVTSGFPRMFEVDAPYAYVYKYMDVESAVVLAMVDGHGGIVTGVEYDDNGKAWYKVSRYYAGAEYVGYVDAQLISVGYSAPSTGGSAGGSTGGGTDGGTDVPIPTPVIPDGGGENLSDNISEFTTFVASVPLIIAALFSFLPPWCLALTGVGFAILIFVMVKRATVG